MFYKDKLLSPAQLKRLSDHKYSCTSVSLVDPILQPWWNWLLARTPLWIAPNLITILGLIVNIVTTLILVWYSPDAKVEVCVVRLCSIFRLIIWYSQQHWSLTVLILTGTEMGVFRLCFGFVCVPEFRCNWWETGQKNRNIKSPWWIVWPWLWLHFYRSGILLLLC